MAISTILALIDYYNISKIIDMESLYEASFNFEDDFNQESDIDVNK
ncbi:23526_t:CDS:2 [Gigaspora margarita]|uniref:23526_t:CDS:1 n=1 Tax=Gigaspora margarita TaxID=4874 RepID=A0ABN7UKN4_GIGMA|nr:23526_t:CDS:2 [Gigaspora margarita]